MSRNVAKGSPSPRRFFVVGGTRPSPLRILWGISGFGETLHRRLSSPDTIVPFVRGPMNAWGIAPGKVGYRQVTSGKLPLSEVVFRLFFN
ncbi:hypothetical protein DP73_03945 [Desulfosporosinus sp. HMP52]|uniref:hypothetical protein n=1 Tax=Desulfosporosinus sp. HMP52 TaxID=1487923 RepID=UPI00051F9A33|nr:hypothetical protein [Desulfosporosinus sp. HMP52]KGK91286.1 hypothetical protein DP73_03945 [Desulfosporosinus sp. HMP52]